VSAKTLPTRINNSDNDSVSVSDCVSFLIYIVNSPLQFVLLVALVLLVLLLLTNPTNKTNETIINYFKYNSHILKRLKSPERLVT